MPAKIKDIESIRIPLLGNPLNRGTDASKDQRFVNGFFINVQNKVTGKETYFFTKRPGAARRIQPSGAAGVGRGIYSWKGSIYTVIGTKIYKDTTDLGVTLTTSTGMCGITETSYAAGTQYLGINDGVKLFLVDTAGTVSTITLNFPTPNTTDLIYLDTYFFVCKADGTILNCNSNDPPTWDTTKTITMNMFNGQGVGLAHQNSFLIAFSDKSIQGFVDNANSSGSPLVNVESVAQQVGCASQNSIVQDESLVTWVGNSYTGGPSVWMLNGVTNLEEIADSELRLLLTAEGTSITASKGNLIRIAGKKFYLLRLSAANRTFVYDYVLKIWNEWESAAGGTAWPFVDFYQHSYGLIALHDSDGYVYDISTTTYQDNSVNFTVLARFGRVDLETDDRKFVNSQTLIGDKQSTTTNVSFQYSDDDYVTLSSARTFNMALVRPYLSGGGSFIRRAFQLSYAGSNPLRIQALQLRFKLQS